MRGRPGWNARSLRHDWSRTTQVNDTIIPNWTDWADLFTHSAVQGEMVDRSVAWNKWGDGRLGSIIPDSTFRRLGWHSGLNGRTMIDRRLPASKGWKLRFAMDGFLNIDDGNMVFSQPGMMILTDPSENSSPVRYRGLQIVGDVTGNTVGLDGQNRYGIYLWNVNRDNPNQSPGNTTNRLWNNTWPKSPKGSSDPGVYELTYDGTSIRQTLNGECHMPSVPIPPLYAGRFRAGLYWQQGFGAATWSLPGAQDKAPVDFMEFEPWAGTNPPYPATPLAGDGGATSLKAAGATTITPTWPTDLAGVAGKRVFIVIHKVGGTPGTPTVPVVAGYTFTFIGTSATTGGNRVAVWETVTLGTETPGGPIGAWASNSGSPNMVAATFAVTGHNPQVKSIGAVVNNPGSSTIVLGPSEAITSRNILNLWIVGCTGATINGPLGYTQVVQAGLGGAHTGNIAVFQGSEGLVTGETLTGKAAIQKVGSASGAVNAYCVVALLFPDPNLS